MCHRFRLPFVVNFRAWKFASCFGQYAVLTYCLSTLRCPCLLSSILKLICYNPPFAYCFGSYWFADITTFNLFLHRLSNAVDSNKVHQDLYIVQQKQPFHFQRCWICQMLFISLLFHRYFICSNACFFQFLLIWREKNLPRWSTFPNFCQLIPLWPFSF